MSKTEILGSPGGESEAIARLAAEINTLYAQHITPCLIGQNGEHVEIPPTIFQALRAAVDAMKAGRPVTLMPVGHELTSQEAADILLVSRPHLIKLLDRGEMPFHRVGRNRRIRLDDVLSYQARRAQERERLLTQLAQDAQDAGGYAPASA